MGDHVKIHRQTNTHDSWSDSDGNSGNGYSSDSESSVASRRLNDSCEDLHCFSCDQSINSEANSEIIAWMVEEYQKSLAVGKDIKGINDSQQISIAQKAKLFIGDRGEKHAAIHIACTKIAACYYTALRNELEAAAKKYCSKSNLEELKGFNQFVVTKQFQDFEFNSLESTVIWLKEKEHLQESVQTIILERTASLTNSDLTWLQKVSKQQYEYFEVFTLMATKEDLPYGGCPWIEIKKEDDCLLELIGYIVYKKTHPLSEYLEEELDKIKPIAEQIRSQSTTDPISLSCIFLIYQLENKDIIEVVFRVRNNEAVLFIDLNQRVYMGWGDFVDNNKLPPCLYCYPSGGEYNKKKGFQVNFTWSPESYTGKRLINVLDVVGKVATVGSAAALGVAAAIHTLPVVAVGGTVAAVVSGAYGINRGISKILDKVYHVQTVGTQDVVNVLSNVLSVASGGVAEVVPALATMGSSMLVTQSAVQGLNAITTLIPEYESNNNIAPQSGELHMQTLLFFNSKSPEEAIENIKETYHLAPNKSTIFVIKTFVLANSVSSAFDGTIQKYFSKSLTSLILSLVDAVEGGIKRNFMDTLFLRDIFNHGKFISLDNAFTSASKREKTAFFRLLIDSVCKISSLCAKCIPIRSYRGMEFHLVSEVFEQIDFAVLAKGSFTIDKYLDAQIRLKLKNYFNKILTLISDRDENKNNCSKSLSEFTDRINTKWPEILAMFDTSSIHKKVRFENP